MLQKKKITFSLLLLVLMGACTYPAKEHINLEEQAWIHGSEDCEQNSDPLIQVVKYDEDTWILRQNKCTNYEAPFMFLFFGKNKALLMDTGATREEDKFPLYQTVKSLIDARQKEYATDLQLVVAHTHAHGDHHAADAQFQGKPATSVIGLQVEDIKSFFAIENWPENNAVYDLGDRALEIIPIPGHQKSSIAVYDPQSGILLTGDTFYPGRLYVEDWSVFKESIRKLYDFTKKHEISYILGNHIEMSLEPGKDYPIGTLYQPEEQKLPLYPEDLEELHKALERLGDQPTREIHDKFIIYPIK
ncbi:MBL fold metallo-hydrolase [Leptobacterium flavescens]|uniref:MBL fold metallo-hydrolase n=1 Tax=Leptobacterium flavescens TaxID=472055 RepID=A0A6P0UNG2_9FLAO|nr:MBL fold metallo-hydrolase [Leptobacterium flavescens]NER11856.1 MBL fold metallo-hydrolase [Leptobacterium flavescens]